MKNKKAIEFTTSQLIGLLIIIALVAFLLLLFTNLKNQMFDVIGNIFK